MMVKTLAEKLNVQAAKSNITLLNVNAACQPNL